MGYYMRFISADEKKVNLSEIESALKDFDSNYRIDRDESDETVGMLNYSGEVYGQLEINEKGGGIFEDEIEMLKGQIKGTEGKNKQKVLEVLNHAEFLVFLRVLNQGRDDEETFEKIDPIWDWLLENRTGLVQADLEGYYDASALIFEV